jgi:hypothetical protein
MSLAGDAVQHEEGRFACIAPIQIMKTQVVHSDETVARLLGAGESGAYE